LRLQPSTLHGYLQVLAWVQANHPEWLQPKPKGYIPNLTRATALIWIEKRLERGVLTPEQRAELEKLRQEALEGKLTDKEGRDYRGRTKRPPDFRAFLTRLRALRGFALQIPSFPDAGFQGLDQTRQAVEGRVLYPDKKFCRD